MSDVGTLRSENEELKTQLSMLQTQSMNNDGIVKIVASTLKHVNRYVCTQQLGRLDDWTDNGVFTTG